MEFSAGNPPCDDRSNGFAKGQRHSVLAEFVEIVGDDIRLAQLDQHFLTAGGKLLVELVPNRQCSVLGFACGSLADGSEGIRFEPLMLGICFFTLR